VPGYLILEPALCYPPGILVSSFRRDGISPAAELRMNKVRHGARNWVYVSCARHGIHSGKLLVSGGVVALHGR